MNILEQNKVAILNTDPQKSREFFEKYKANNKVRLFYNRFDWFYYVENGEVDCWPECPSRYTPAGYDWQPPNTYETLNEKISALITEATACGLSLEGGRFVKKVKNENYA